jgi:hypothetical protein
MFVFHFLFWLHTTFDGMTSKGLRDTNLSVQIKFDAGDELSKPLKPLLTICGVGSRAI